MEGWLRGLWVIIKEYIFLILKGLYFIVNYM